MEVVIKKHGKCEFVGFSRQSDKGREKGYEDLNVPLFKIPGYESPQCVSMKDIVEHFPIDAWTVVDNKVVKVRITTRYKTIGSVYHLSEHNAKLKQVSSSNG